MKTASGHKRAGTSGTRRGASPDKHREEQKPPRLARVAKGRKPQYFSDPAIDKLLSITMSLIGELSVTRDRLDTVERLLASRKVLRIEDIEGYLPTPEVAAARERKRQAYLARVLRAVEAELTETTHPSMPKSAEEVIAAVSR